MAKGFTYDFTPNGFNPDILWMEANEQKGGCSGTGGISIVGSDGNKTAYTLGMEYEGNDSFTMITVNYLNQIAKKSTTAFRMFSELIKSGFSYQIVESDENSKYSPANQEMYAVYEEEEQYAFYVAGGGTVFFNPQGREVFEKAVDRTTSELKNRPEMGLIHELAHAWDNMAGLLAPDDRKFDKLEINEWMSMRTENAIRAEMSFPQRTSYEIIIYTNGSKPQPSMPKLFTSKGAYRFTQYFH